MRATSRFRACARALAHALVLSSLALVACNERAADLREWRVSDHDHTDNPGSDQVQVDPNDAGTAPPGLDDVTIVAWQQNCTQCHGQLGRGDGPRGPMLKATNFSDPAWQKATTDEQIARVIKEGRGAMPPFKLPDATIARLVKLVRMFNAARLQGHPETSPSSGTLPPGHPPTTAPALPPGHPPTGAPSAATPKPSAAPKPAPAAPAQNPGAL